MESVHDIFVHSFDSLKVLFFSERPGRVFPKVEQPVSIFIAEMFQARNEELIYQATEFIKFQTGELAGILKSLNLQHVNNEYIILGKLPKIGFEIPLSILKKLSKIKNSISDFFDFSAHTGISIDNKIFYKNAGGRYYKPFTTFFNGVVSNGVARSSTTQGILYIKKSIYKEPICAILNSSLYFWLYQVYSDCWHLNPDDFRYFKIDLNEIEEDVLQNLTQLNQNLMENFMQNSITKENFKSGGKIEYKELYARKGKHIIDEIDDILATVYKINVSELDYIKSFR
jgi:hypothetical protein